MNETYRIHDEIGRLSIEIKVCDECVLVINQLIQDGPFRGHWRDYRLYQDGKSDTGISMQRTYGDGLFKEVKE